MRSLSHQLPALPDVTAVLLTCPSSTVDLKYKPLLGSPVPFPEGTLGSLPPLPLTQSRPQRLPEGSPTGISAPLSCLAAAGPGPSAKSTTRASS